MVGLFSKESPRGSIANTLLVAALVCLACSIVVSAAAVLLRPEQQINRSLDRQKNILTVAGLLEDGDEVDSKTIQSLYNQHVEPRIINLETGEFVKDIDPATFNQRDAARDPATSMMLTDEQDMADIKRRADYASVYLIQENGETRYVVLPIHGYGLWSTIYGFIALENDFNTIYGVSFFEHAETPGLGGEIENPQWKARWRGKKLFDEGSTDVALEVIKGNITEGDAGFENKIDGLAGATLTSRGVSNMLRFWFGQYGYQPFISKQNSQRG